MDVKYAINILKVSLGKIIFLMFILRERERERERERIPSRLHTVSTEPDVGLGLTNCEIMT